MHTLVSTTKDGDTVTVVTSIPLTEFMAKEGIKMLMLVGDCVYALRPGDTDWEPYPFDDSTTAAEIVVTKRKN